MKKEIFLLYLFVFYFFIPSFASHKRPFSDLPQIPYLVQDFNPYEEVQNSYPLSNFAFLNGKAYFITGEKDSYYPENISLWESDGTKEGTKRIYNFPMKRLSVDSSFPIVSSGGKIFFAISNGDEDIYLWVSNGKTEGTKPLISIRGLWDFFKIEIVPFKDKVLFFRLTGDYSLYV